MGPEKTLARCHYSHDATTRNNLCSGVRSVSRVMLASPTRESPTFNPAKGSLLVWRV